MKGKEMGAGKAGGRESSWEAVSVIQVRNSEDLN